VEQALLTFPEITRVAGSAHLSRTPKFTSVYDGVCVGHLLFAVFTFNIACITISYFYFSG
jgi:hypothetical protein